MAIDASAEVLARVREQLRGSECVLASSGWAKACATVTTDDCGVLLSADACTAEALGVLRAAAGHVPVIALVPAGDDDAIERALDAGADGWAVLPGIDGLKPLLKRLQQLRAEAERVAVEEARLRSETLALVSLAFNPDFHGDDLHAALRGITEAGAHGAHVARVSVWRADPLGLRCVDLYESEKASHSEGGRLRQAEAFAYFESLRSQRFVIANDVEHDPRTQPLLARHLHPAGIGATLDFAMTSGGELLGVVSLSHVGGPRVWTTGETMFARGLAEAATLACVASARAHAERRAHTSERRFAELFTHSRDLMVLCAVRPDGEAIFEDVNPATVEFLRQPREALVGVPVRKVTGPAFGALDVQVSRMLADGVATDCEAQVTLQGETKTVAMSFVPLPTGDDGLRRYAALARDVTAHREDERQAARAQRMEALGNLAGHVAHDFNNILTGVAGWAHRLEGSPEPLVRTAGENIREATERGRELTAQVLTFGQRQPSQRVPVKLAEVVREAARLLEPTRPEHIRFEVQAEEAVEVMADAGQLHQLVVNLCRNGLQAMARSGGALVVSVRSASVDAAFARAHPPLTPGRWAQLSVSDDGHGMDSATLARVFEPYFTTRTRGDGTGLGLPVVHGVAQSHGGTVVARSTPGEGTTFEVYLPLRPALSSQATPSAAGHRLMLVDDQTNVARTSAMVLEQLGYRTSIFHSAEDALAAFTSAPEQYDVVLTDWSMPEMNGEALAQALHAVRPQVPVIVTTGGVLDDAELERAGITAVLGKPWRPEEATRVLGDALAQAHH